MEAAFHQDFEGQPRIRSYPKCKLLLNRIQYRGELIDLSLKGALFAPEGIIEDSHNKACRLHLEGIESAINGIVIQEEPLLCIKFLGVRNADQKTIETLVGGGLAEVEPGTERDMSDLMRRSKLIQIAMHH